MWVFLEISDWTNNLSLRFVGAEIAILKLIVVSGNVTCVMSFINKVCYTSVNVEMLRYSGEIKEKFNTLLKKSMYTILLFFSHSHPLIKFSVLVNGHNKPVPREGRPPLPTPTEYLCLVRASLRSKKISTIVSI